jgi:putative ABC transport system permease protein
MRAASPGYFDAMAIPVIAGRGLLESDTRDSTPVLVVNQAMARRFWPDGDVLGRRLSIAGPDGPWLTIVGMVGDVKHKGLSAEAGPEMYLPFQQETWPSLTVVVRSAVDTAVMSQSVRKIIAGLDAELPLHDVRTLDGVVADALKQPRLQSLFVVSFAMIALILSAAGVFGVTAHSVSRRIQEIAIRMALGCEPRAALVLVMRQGVRLAATGLLLGGASAWLMVRALSGIVFGVRPHDPLVFAATLAMVSGVALTAAYLPARRASRVDPAIALRT